MSTSAPFGATDVRRFLTLLHEPGDVFEIRIPKHGKYRFTACGYFDDVDTATAAIAGWDGRASIYITLNEVNPALLARAVNRMVERAEATTADADVLRRRWLFLDLDAVRPSGISSTDEEVAQARRAADEIAAILRSCGWPEPILVASGNGAYLLFRVDLPNDEHAGKLVTNVLSELASRFDSDRVKVDPTVSNASRIIGLVGTKKMKGESTEDRPHRRSQIISAPEQIVIVTLEQLEALVGQAAGRAKGSSSRTSHSVSLVEMLHAKGIEFREQAPDAHGVSWYHVRHCPFHDDGRPFECGVGQKLPDGPYAGHCFHPEGKERGWHDFKHALGLGVAAHHDPAMVSGDPTHARTEHPRSDAGNGELFARLYGDRVRYDHRRNRWLVWRGHHWTDDADGEVRRLAKLTVRHRQLDTHSIEDLNQRAAASRFAIQSEGRQRLDALLAQAQSEPPITDAGSQWDSDAWSLGVANGVVDLRSGALRDGKPNDRITMHVPVAYNPAATCPRWLRFLDEVFGGNAELIDFIQRAAGYSLTAMTTEQCLFLCYGTGSNGKSVFLNVLREVAGQYGHNAAFSLFELRSRSAIPNDVAALYNRRLVTSSETNEGTRLNEARVKALTGGDRLSARFLHAEFFEFDPTGKYWLAVNHQPNVEDDSHGFWRRVRLIPFVVRFAGEQADSHLLLTLRSEMTGILAWAVDGARGWHERGLEAPQAVRAATESYRVESDPLARFIDERCVIHADASVLASSAYKAYQRWGLDEGMKDKELLTSTKFGTKMTARFEKRKRNDGSHYVGVGLRTDRSDPTPDERSFGADLTPHAEKVTGCESEYPSLSGSSLVTSLTRKNLNQPVTPVTSYCKRWGCELSATATSNLCDECRLDALRVVMEGQV